MARITEKVSFIDRHQIRRIRWSIVAVAAATVCSAVLWQLALARHIQLQPRVAEPPPRAAMQSEQKVESLPPYDLAAIDADTTYYQRADASRLDQMAPIPAGQKRHEEIQIASDPWRLALPHSWLEQPLVVRAKPGRPVTFVALDSGKFTNNEITITVKADALGFAAARFFVSNEGNYRVLAGSPENAGPAQFMIRCVSKELRDDVESGRYARQYVAKQRAAEEQRLKAAAEVAERIRRQRSAK